MKKEKNIKSYTAAELKSRHAKSRTDLSRVDAMTDEKLERLIAEDEDERGLRPDWTKAKLILPQAKQSEPSLGDVGAESSLLAIREEGEEERREKF